MLINYISNLPKELRSGGFSAMNAAAFQSLGKAHRVHYAGPVDPSPQVRQKMASKAFRLLGLPGKFFFFSERRLSMIAGDVEIASDGGADLDFFHGFTPWIATRPSRSYAAWSDCSFRDYISHYHRRADFRAADLERIEQSEAAWLRGARAVGFTSIWAAERTIRDYNLDPALVSVVGIFGEIELPLADVYAGSQQFAFVSTDFKAKGGPVVLAAFHAVKALHPNASLVIVGDVPAGLRPEPGVTIVGFLRKEDSAEDRRLREILAASRAVVHPTRSDIAPLLLVEAGYFGCPVISTRQFAIGEIVNDGVTGILIDDAKEISAIAAAMISMLEMEPDRYLAMRQAAWTHSRETHSKVRFESRLLAMVESARRRT